MKTIGYCGQTPEPEIMTTGEAGGLAF